MMGNCDVRGTVNFGDGPVLVRCTRTDADHLDHVCTVLIKDPSKKKGKNG